MSHSKAFVYDAEINTPCLLAFVLNRVTTPYAFPLFHHTAANDTNREEDNA